MSLMIVLSVTGAMALPLLGLWLTGKGIDPGAIWALSVTGALFAATALGLAAIRAGYTGGTTGHEPPLKVLRSALRGTALPVGCAAFVLAVAAVSTGYAAPSAAVVFAGASAGLVVLWGVFLPGLLMLKPSPPASSVAPLKPRVWASTTRHFSGVAVAVAGVALLIMSRREAPAAIAPELAAGLPIVSLFETESEARVFASAVASVAGVSEVIASAAGVTAALAARDRVLSTEAWALLSRRAAVERDRLRGQPAPVFKPSTVEDLKVWASRHETSDSAHARSAATLIQALTSGETATTERALSFAASAAGYALKGLRASWQRTLTDASAEGDAAAAGDAAADRAFFDVSSGRAFAAVVVGPNVSDPRIVNPLDGDATARRPPAVGLLFWAGVAASLLVLCLASAVSAWPRVLALPAVALLGATPVFHAQTLLDAPPPVDHVDRLDGGRRGRRHLLRVPHAGSGRWACHARAPAGHRGHAALRADRWSRRPSGVGALSGGVPGGHGRARRDGRFSRRRLTLSLRPPPAARTARTSGPPHAWVRALRRCPRSPPPRE